MNLFFTSVLQMHFRLGKELFIAIVEVKSNVL